MAECYIAGQIKDKLKVKGDRIKDCTFSKLDLGDPFAFVSMQGTCFYYLTRAQTAAAKLYFDLDTLASLTNSPPLQPFSKVACESASPTRSNANAKLSDVVYEQLLSDPDFKTYVGNYDCEGLLRTIQGSAYQSTAAASLSKECLAVRVWIGVFSALGATGKPWKVNLYWDHRGGSNCV